jgi:hypothetical protein
LGLYFINRGVHVRLECRPRRSSLRGDRCVSFLAFYQTLNGIDVFNGQIKFTLSKTGEVIHAGAARNHALADFDVRDSAPPEARSGLYLSRG